ncbi:hypothetical protein RI543_002660 [Arxiozyma heterogenica]|uniref:YTH domain-containing protein n=1 Tax=Arxiozyma heterogenica TaxID=278026 RepID=A0AAN7WT65_9SACH|nr:hypothetical protein RI543_002660 [Kazachstania heterogenica]
MNTSFISNNSQFPPKIIPCNRTIEDSLKDLETFVVSSTTTINTENQTHLLLNNHNNPINDYNNNTLHDNLNSNNTIDCSKNYYFYNTCSNGIKQLQVNYINDNRNSIPRTMPNLDYILSQPTTTTKKKLNENKDPTINCGDLQNSLSLSSSQRIYPTTLNLNMTNNNNHNNMKIHNNYKSIKSSAIIPTWINIPVNSKFFIIKSNSLEHVKKSFYNSIWSSTHFGNKRLSESFKNLDTNKYSKLFLFFSVNGSGKFCGVAEMISDLRDDLDTSIWSNNGKFGLAFKVRWVIVRDIHNKYLKRFLLPNNEMKPVTNSRDTQEIPYLIGAGILKLFKSQNPDIEVTSFLDSDY